MLDEGFYNFLAKFIIDETGKVQGRSGMQIIRTMPKIDLLIHVKSDVSTCIQRMRMREQGIPLPYQNLSGIQIEENFSRYNEFFNKYIALIKNKGIKTIEIDNNQPLDEAKSQLTNEIGYLL